MLWAVASLDAQKQYGMLLEDCIGQKKPNFMQVYPYYILGIAMK